MNIPKIFILEESSIIQKGLSTILLEKNKDFDISAWDSSCDWEHMIALKKPQILIVSPIIYKNNTKALQTLSEKHKFSIIGLIYSYHHPQSLIGFDALIQLYDQPPTILTTINKTLQNQKKLSPNINHSLSAREAEVLKWLSTGYSTKKIADKLNISIHTVNAHRKNIMKKLDIRTISGLTIYAVINNIISLQDV